MAGVLGTRTEIPKPAVQSHTCQATTIPSRLEVAMVPAVSTIARPSCAPQAANHYITIHLMKVHYIDWLEMHSSLLAVITMQAQLRNYVHDMTRLVQYNVFHETNFKT